MLWEREKDMPCAYKVRLSHIYSPIRVSALTWQTTGGLPRRGSEVKVKAVVRAQGFRSPEPLDLERPRPLPFLLHGGDHPDKIDAQMSPTKISQVYCKNRICACFAGIHQHDCKHRRSDTSQSE